MNKPAPRDLKSVEKRFAAWRQNRVGGKSRIPDNLWKEAAEVAVENGIHRTAKTLRLSYYDLKKRVEALPSTAVMPGERTKSSVECAFVELNVDQVQTTVGSRAGVIIEMAGRAGERMRIDVADRTMVDVPTVVEAFWRSAS